MRVNDEGVSETVGIWVSVGVNVGGSKGDYWRV
jgi:hypothetical protein